MEEKKKVSKLKAIICFIINLITGFFLYDEGSMIVYIYQELETIDEESVKIFLIAAVISIINGIVAAKELKKGHDPDKMSFAKYLIRCPFFLNGFFVWMLFVSVMIPFFLVFAIALVILVLIWVLGDQLPSKKKGSGGSQQNTIRHKCAYCGREFSENMMVFDGDIGRYSCRECQRKILNGEM